MADFIKTDLDFILHQISIAEGHSAALLANPNMSANAQRLLLIDLMVDGPGAGSPTLSLGLRTVDASFNNLIPGRHLWGAADQPFLPIDGTGPDFPVIGDADYSIVRGPGTSVTDSTPRTISNLVVDMTVDNPAAVQAALDHYEVEDQATILGLSDALRAAKIAGDPGPITTARTNLINALTTAGVEFQEAPDAPPGLLSLPNVAPDEGLSAPFNSWMTLFGQFFDHGLDLVAKGGGNVVIPLLPDDPLFIPGSPTNFMILSRAATNNPVNNTTAQVDQNQTYASNASHQVFLREYVLDENGRPVATGSLIEGSNGGMATWADVKAQAEAMLGIVLDDHDALMVPEVRVDPYGNFIPGPNGFPQLFIGGQWVSGTPGAPIDATLAAKTQHAFLLDIAHAADPNGKIADDDNGLGLNHGGPQTNVYDDELLDRHFIAGDGRANENIGLTAVHHVFHSEHNRLVIQTKSIVVNAMIDGEGTPAEDLAFINAWLRPAHALTLGDLPVGEAGVAALLAQLNATDAWDGERIFQAARFGTEMQYQHLVFEDFARKIQPQIDIFVAPVGYDTDINPAIFAEFAHTVYRFGHSMLTESIDRLTPTFQNIGENYQVGADDQIDLVAAFLNPIEFDDDGLINADVAAGAVIRGMTRQVGNEIDEFVTSALRSNLLGLPLDLATINIARGRDTGVPTLNDARKSFFQMTGDSQLRPYESWFDFAMSLKNQTSIVNFIAAYGQHGSITGATTYEEKREAAMLLVFGGTGAPLDREDFLHSEGAWANAAGNNSITGLDDVDLWIGGLAERIMPFGGMLGSTFNFVFETQLENLQNGDRFYYLARTAGLNFLTELENNSFTTLLVNNSDARHLPIDAFSTPAYILEVQQNQQFNAGLGSADPTQGGLVPLVDRNPGGGTTDPTGGLTHRYLRYNGEDHVVLGGTSGNDRLIGSIGDDTFWGDGGDDTIEGGLGNDNIDGGAGHDIITDTGGDDVIKGGAGNDVIHGGPGINLIISGHGNDFVVTGEDVGEVFAGGGNDFVYGQTTNEAMHGNEGHDWIERGTQDGAMGDNADTFGADGITGHDVFLGSGSFDEYVGEGGDDIMVGSAGQNRNEGMSGFDWVTYKDTTTQVEDVVNGVYADLLLPAFDEDPNIPFPETALDRYENVEGVSGGAGNDTLRGTDVTAAEMGAEGARGSALTNNHISLISGLNLLLGNGVLNAGDFDAGNIMLGGLGSDLIEGRGGDDVIHGDRWLNVKIVWNNPGGASETFFSLAPMVPRMVSGEIKPGDLEIVREIVNPLAPQIVANIDTAVYTGPIDNYTIDSLVGGGWRVTDNVGEEGIDTLYGIEQLRFDDPDSADPEDFIFEVISAGPIGGPQILEATPNGTLVTPTQGEQLTASAILGDGGNINDPDGISGTPNVQYLWQQSANGTTWTPIAGATFATFTPGAAQVGQFLRVRVQFNDGGTPSDRETVFSATTAMVGALFLGNANANLFNGNAGANRAIGGGGNDTLNGNLGDDTLSGDAGNDTINGGEGNDSLGGGIGNDQLDGGLGNDTLIGGGGNDTYIVNDTGDTILEAGGAGNDHITTTLNFFSIADIANVERLTFNGIGDFEGVGNTLANVLTGNAGSNNLSGGGGNDTLNGAGANDTLDGGAGADQLNGGAGDDSVLGGAGNDNLNGDAGNDTLDGGAGSDNMVGGGGDDFFFVNATGDVTNGGAGIDTASSTVTRTIGNGVENLILTGAANISATGNNLANEITGNAGNNTFTIGSGGNDTIKFAGGAFGADIVAGFDAAGGVGAQDFIDLSIFGITAATFEGAVDHHETIGGAGNTLVRIFDENNVQLGTLRVNGVTPGNLEIDDFILAGI
jgi:Ca2+-binding RTX toxin-like protein